MRKSLTIEDHNYFAKYLAYHGFQKQSLLLVLSKIWAGVESPGGVDHESK